MILPEWVLYLGFACIAIAAYFLLGSFAFGAGYQPAPRRVVDRMLQLAELGPHDFLYDLGAGTGGIIFRAAREHGAYVVGVEVDPVRVLILRLRRLIGGPRERIRIRWGNLLDVDLSHATVIAVFLWPGAMTRLRPKMEKELQPGTRIVSHWHEVPGWTPDTFDRETRVYAYTWRGGGGTGGTAPA